MRFWVWIYRRIYNLNITTIWVQVYGNFSTLDAVPFKLRFKPKTKIETVSRQQINLKNLKFYASFALPVFEIFKIPAKKDIGAKKLLDIK